MVVKELGMVKAPYNPNPKCSISKQSKHYKYLPAKCVVDQIFEYLKHLCSGTHPCHISYPKESPQAISEPENTWNSRHYQNNIWILHSKLYTIIR